MYLLTIVGDYDFSDLKIINEDFAQIFVALYFVLVSVITLNLFIALMSEAIARINDKAKAQAYLKEAEEITSIEKYFPAYKDEFESFLRKEGNPWVSSSFSFNIWKHKYLKYNVCFRKTIRNPPVEDINGK